MKTKDIKPGDHLAYAAYRPRRYRAAFVLGGSSIQEATVVSIDRGQVTVKIGDDTFQVAPVSLLGTWAEHQEVVAARKQQRAESIQRLDESAATIKRLTEGSGVRLPYGFDGKIERDGSYAKGGTMQAYELARLLEAAYAKGMADAQAGE